MRKIQILMVLVTVLAFAILTVPSASATLWLISGRSLTVATSTSTHGTIFLHDSLGILVKCTGLLNGSVGPGALDLINLSEDLQGNKDLVRCEVTQDASKLCGSVNELTIVHVVNLTWHTLLELSGTETIDQTLSATAGYEVLCPSGINVKCETLEAAKFLGNDSDGALFEYAGTKKLKCSAGEGTILSTFLMLNVTVS